MSSVFPYPFVKLRSGENGKRHRPGQTCAASEAYHQSGNVVQDALDAVLHVVHEIGDLQQPLPHVLPAPVAEALSTLNLVDIK